MSDANNDDRIVKVLRIQNRLSYEIGKTTSLETAFGICIEAALEATNMDMGGIYLINQGGGLDLKHHNGLDEAFVSSVSGFAKDTAQVRGVLAGNPIYFGENETPMPKTSDMYRALAVIPFSHKGTVIGCLNIGTKCSKEISEADKHTLETIGRHVGDLIARVSAEDSLRKSEEKYRALIEMTGTGYLILDEAGNVIDANEEYVRLTGHHSLPEILGRNVIEWTAERDVAKNEREVRECIEQGGISNLDIDYVDKHGNITPVEINARVIDTDSGTRILSLCRDISKRKILHDELEFRNTLLSTQMESSIDGILVVGKSGNILSFNRRFAQMWGIPPDIMGTRSDELAIQAVLDKIVDPSVFLEKVQHLYGHENETSQDEIVLKDGRIFDRYSAPMIGADSRNYGRVWFFRDITENRRAAEEKNSLLKQLHHSQKMEAIGQLAGGIAHDFNNILAVIIGTAQQVERTLPDSGQNRKHMERITRVAKRAKDLTMNLLTFARKEKLDVRALQTNDLVHELADLLKRSISKKIVIRTKCDEDAPVISVDVNQMLQSLLNMCINAADAMEDGGTLTIECGRVSLESHECAVLSGITPGNYCRIAISDTGAGMSDEVKEQIFTPFFTTKERGKGTGLGLSITLGIVQSHGGAVWVDSEPGIGTTMNVYIPVQEASVVKQADSAVEDRRISVRGTILIVDDDRDFLDMMNEILLAKSFNIMPATGPAMALELYGKHQSEIDLVILDMMMPEMGGDEVFRLLQKINPDVKVIVCSGYSSDGKAGQTLSEGAIGFLQKPFDISQLICMLSNLM